MHYLQQKNHNGIEKIVTGMLHNLWHARYGQK